MLKDKKCVPCEGGVKKMESLEIKNHITQLNLDWQVVENKKIKREFSFVNFVHTMDFVNRVADLAESEGHHPDLHVSYGKCVVWLWTHAIGGLSMNDFILASKIDAL